MRFLPIFSLALTGLLAVSTSFSPSVYAANLYGTNNSETIYGTTSPDVIVGYAGNDVIYGGDGADAIYGNAGNDILIGDQGVDTFYGGAGNDTIYMYAGDTSNGDNGLDTIYVQTGDYDVCPKPSTVGSPATIFCTYTIRATNPDGSFDRIYTPNFAITAPGTYNFSYTYNPSPAWQITKRMTINVY